MVDCVCTKLEDIAITKYAVKEMKDDIKNIKQMVNDFIKEAPNKFAEKKEFLYWRNLIIGSVVGLIISVITLIILESISLFYK